MLVANPTAPTTTDAGIDVPRSAGVSSTHINTPVQLDAHAERIDADELRIDTLFRLAIPES
jgi:hypothetical protein